MPCKYFLKVLTYALDFTMVQWYILSMKVSKRASTDRNLWNRDAQALLQALLMLQTPAEARKLLRDLMTEDEIRMIVARWRVARSLNVGHTYKQIEQRTGLSSRTIARISRWLKHGKGGYRKALQKATSNRKE